MPRPAKGPRLYLRKGRVDAKTGRRLPDIYFIRDGQTEISTGCGPAELSGPHGAESQLANYIVGKHAPRPAKGAEAADEAVRRRDPDQVLIAEVVAYYLHGRWGATLAADESADADQDETPADRAARVSAANVATRMKAILGWWGDKVVSQVRRSTSDAYVKHRTSQPIASFKADNPDARLVTVAGARRELEDLSAAIGYWHDEHRLTDRPKVVLPAKAETQRESLTRGQVARLLMAARGYRLDPNGVLHASGRPKWVRLRDSGPANRAHLKRFILIGVYSGTRPGVIPQLLWEMSATQAYVDLEANTIFRRGKLEREHRTKRRPLVKIAPRLAAHMRRWRRIDQRVMKARAKEDQPTSNTVLHHGGYPIAGRLRRSFASAVQDAGLNLAATPHWQRHTAATWLMQGGADLYEAAGYLGMTVKTLEDHYLHHHPAYQASAMAAIGGRK